MPRASSPSPGATVVQRRVQGIRLGHRGRVTQLHTEDGRPGMDRGMLRRAAPGVVPGVEHGVAVGPTGLMDDLPGRRQVGMRDQGRNSRWTSRPCSPPGRTSRRRPPPPRRVTMWPRTRRPRSASARRPVGDSEGFPSDGTEDPSPVELRRDVDLRHAREPPPGGVELASARPWSATNRRMSLWLRPSSRAAW